MAVEQVDREAAVIAVPNCRDYDDDCAEIQDKVHCWLYDPAKGACPYLREPRP